MRLRSAIIFVLILWGAGVGAARAAGPDVIVADIPDVLRYGRVGDITAYAIGTISCNMGDTPMSWVANTNQHPVIAQNIYRLKNGRFEQIGMAWVKHGFASVNDTFCGPCQNPGSSSLLGVGCSDPYNAGLNGTQALLGPRSEVNASTGFFPYPFGDPATPPTIGRRLQVHDADIDPDLNAGALYFVEGQYVHPQDAAADNDNNNASYRRVLVTEQNPPSTTWNITLTSTTQREKPGIQAWQDNDATVMIAAADVPGDGRFILGVKATDLQNGFWRYEYAIQNLNSDRSAGSFAVPLHEWTVVQNIAFHDVDYHSGEPYSLTDWPATRTATQLSWATTPFATDPNANALRWATLYNFRFDANVPPIDTAQHSLGLFKPGSPAGVTIVARGPQTTAPDCNGNGTPDFLEIQANPSLDCDNNGNLDICDLDCNHSGTPDACEIAANPALDCNNNGRLDVCEIPETSPAPGGPFYCTSNCDPDCNVNGVPDACDTASGTDPDCNVNGVPDSCDIAGGGWADCNNNGRPDRCEIPAGSPAPGGPFYCTSNCDPDCNVNGVPDACDIAGGVANDCNNNTVPDSCDIANNPSLDCNLNGSIDSCGEIDCDNDGTPDDCEYPACAGAEILPGDMNCSGTATVDDLPLFIDYVLSGIRSCQADLNTDGRVNGADIRLFLDLIL